MDYAERNDPSQDLTVGSLIEKLSKLHPATIICLEEWDPEWDHRYIWSFKDIDDGGSLTRHRIISNYAHTAE